MFIPVRCDFDTREITVEISVDVGYPSVSENTTLGIDASVSDSDGDSAGPTEVATVTVTSEDAGLPTDPAFTDVLNTISALNNNQQFNGADVSFTDVLNIISAFNSVE